MKPKANTPSRTLIVAAFAASLGVITVASVTSGADLAVSLLGVAGSAMLLASNFSRRLAPELKTVPVPTTTATGAITLHDDMIRRG